MHVLSPVTPWTAARQAPLCPWAFPGRNTRVGCRFHLQAELIFKTPGSDFLGERLSVSTTWVSITGRRQEAHSRGGRGRWGVMVAKNRGYHGLLGDLLKLDEPHLPGLLALSLGWAPWGSGPVSVHVFHHSTQLG